MSHPRYRYPRAVALMALGCLCLPLRAPAQSAPTVTLPIEVLGQGGTTAAVTVNVSSQQTAQSVVGLWMQIYGLSYANKASVQVNSQPWVPLNNTTVNVAEPGKSYGGIGSPYHTLKMTLPLPAGALAAGSNTIRFRFNGTDGISMGFRVLEFNFITAGGAPVLARSTFVYDDPNTWKPLFNNPAVILRGKYLWQNARLVLSPLDRNMVLQAKCGDCHAQDGRDLKYFNFSNLSIVQRSVFHGLSTMDGIFIASYIRSLPGPNPGRPWNPPYQPGPGLDAQPLSNWAAGAGVKWVLDRDIDTLPYIFPNGISADAIATTKTLNVRETPVALMLPDWNRWLPRIHPKDAWGLAFTSSVFAQDYPMIRAMFQNPANATWPRIGIPMNELQHWAADRRAFLDPRDSGPNVPWSPTYSEKVYSTALWQLVKSWEIMQEFNVERMGPMMFGATAEARTWWLDIPFNVSPFMLGIPDNQNGIGGNGLSNRYLSNAWYHLQLTVNNGNRKQQGNDPIDWPYAYGRFNDLNISSKTPDGARLTEWMVKGMQISDNGIGPEQAWLGWSPNRVADVAHLVYTDWEPQWRDFTSDQRTAIANAMLQNWLAKNQQYTPQQYYVGLTTPTETPTITNVYSGRWTDQMWFMLPRFRALGADPTLMDRVTAWANTIWPNVPWSTDNRSH